MKNENDLMRHMLKAFPEAELLMDNDGQYVVYTNLKLRGDGAIVYFDNLSEQHDVVLDTEIELNNRLWEA